MSDVLIVVVHHQGFLKCCHCFLKKFESFIDFFYILIYVKFFKKMKIISNKILNKKIKINFKHSILLIFTCLNTNYHKKISER